jgi:hypothetical protein
VAGPACERIAISPATGRARHSVRGKALAPATPARANARSPLRSCAPRYRRGRSNRRRRGLSGRWPGRARSRTRCWLTPERAVGRRSARLRSVTDGAIRQPGDGLALLVQTISGAKGRKFLRNHPIEQHCRPPLSDTSLITVASLKVANDRTTTAEIDRSQRDRRACRIHLRQPI